MRCAQGKKGSDQKIHRWNKQYEVYLQAMANAPREFQMGSFDPSNSVEYGVHVKHVQGHIISSIDLNDPCGDVMDKYEIIAIVGEGSYGVVMKCRHKETHTIVALKKFLETEEDTTVRRMAIREIRMLKRLRHENLVTMIEAFRFKKRYYLVFEYMEGTILDELEKNPDGLGDEPCRERIFQITRAIMYCHENNIIHRDVKPENVLVSSQGVVKLCDFGFARLVSGQNEPYTEYVATRWYRAPELLVSDSHYGPPVDVWAIGCLFSEMMTGEPLLPGDSDVDQLYHTVKMFGRPCYRHIQLMMKNPSFKGAKKIHNLESSIYKIYDTWQSLASEFLTYCMKMDPNLRPTANELLKHSYFAEDNFSERFIPNLRERVKQEFNENALLRQYKADLFFADIRSRKQEIKVHKPSYTESKKWHINLSQESVKRKLSSDASHEGSFDSRSLLNLNRMSQRFAVAQRLSQCPKNTALQSLKREEKPTRHTEPSLNKYSTITSNTNNTTYSKLYRDKGESINNLKFPTQHTIQKDSRLEKALGLLSKLNQKNQYRPKSSNKDITAFSSNLSPSPPDFQSLQSNSFREHAQSTKSPSHTVLHPTITNINFLKDSKEFKKSPYLIQSVHNVSLQSVFNNQVPLTNHPKAPFKRLDRTVCVETTTPNLEKNSRFKSPPEWLATIAIGQNKHNKGKVHEFSLPTVPGATASPAKTKKKLAPEQPIELKVRTPRILSPKSQKSTPSKSINNKHLPSM